MDDEGTPGLQNWGRYYRPPPLKGNLGLQLMSNVGEPMTMPFLSGGHGSNYTRRECGMPEPFSPKRCIFSPKGTPELSSMPIDYSRDIWFHNNDQNGKILHVFPGNHHQHSNSYGALLPEATVASAGTSAHTLQMLQPVDPPKEEKAAVIEDPGVSQLDIVPLKKRSKGQGRPFKHSKQNMGKKAIAPKEESVNSSGRRRSANKNLDMVINGIDLDLSGIPAPLCTCTGQPQQCYRWGAGGWQSACCTTSMSMYPLPMSTKRKGARIAGRKMSQGAFKKVLEKLAGEGQDFSNPIDLKPFWAKHGTNKFVTISFHAGACSKRCTSELQELFQIKCKVMLLF
ncbi:protein BASIC PENTACYSTEINE2-like [Dendrobium catenatum]|uniref:GAGA-binding transcriptional activator n=1 Tax=Dendrobium catenatum TaxID=906689 RepID=A0A2I0XBD4_9ASPA|nr:protein BASIC PENTACYSTEINE2-like [Dendrobium catenatum]PKU85194.1 Protein Barley B recombinant [Dendrobium catenatum]